MDSFEKYYSTSAHAVIPEPTDVSQTLIAYSKEALRSIFKPGFRYKKAGVIALHLCPNKLCQTDLFTQNPRYSQQRNLTKAMDKINQKWGKRAVFFASEGINQEWKMKRKILTKRYTTDWKEILEIRL